MNSLPQELVDRISSLLCRDDLKSTLLLSRQWQHAAEMYSEAFSDFILTTENAPAFLSTYNGRRIRYLQNVEFEPRLPTLGPETEVEDDCRETANELKAHDEHFTQQIASLFSVLKEVETRASNGMDTQKNRINGSKRLHLTILTPTREVDEAEFCIHRCFVSWRIHLLSPSTLPSLATVRSLTLQGWEMSVEHDFYDAGAWKLDLRVLLDLADKLPNLDSLKCKIGAEEWLGSWKNMAMSNIMGDFAGPRRDSRHDFGKAPLSFSALRHAQLDFLYPLNTVENFDQRRQLPNLTKPALFDPFSSSLRLLSEHLRTMNLRIVADGSLFWPADGSSPPSWPYMESLTVMFHPSTPTGSWYFKGLPGVGVDDGFEVTSASYPPFSTTDAEYEEHDEVADLYWADELCRAQFRVTPNEDTLVPFLQSFAKAVTSMPALKEFALWSPLKFDSLDIDAYAEFDPQEVVNFVEWTDVGLAWGIAYTRPGEEAFMSFPGENHSSDRQLWWMTAGWHPNPELHRMFQLIGRAQHGESLVEHWGADGSEGRLDHRQWFLDWEEDRWPNSR